MYCSLETYDFLKNHGNFIHIFRKISLMGASTNSPFPTPQMSRLRHRQVRRSASCLVGALLLALFEFAFQASAATDTWKSTAVDNNFSNTNNWTGGVPGSADTALFNSTSNFTTLTIASATQALTSLTFDLTAPAYTIGTTGGNGIALSSGGTIQIASTFSGSNITETINAPLTGFGNTNTNNTYTFANNSAAANNNTLVLGGSITSSNNGGHSTAITFGGVGNGSVSGIISGSGGGLSVLKSGSGAWTFTGNNSYTGGTTVSAGTLFANNATSSTGTATVTVNGTGTLGGSGKITGAVNVSASGATINAGGTAGAVGTLSTGALTLSSSSVFSVDMTSTTADQIAVTGAVNITAASLQLNIPNGTAFTAGQQFTLINNDLTDAISGTFSNAPAGTDSIGGYLWIVSYAGGDGNDFVIQAVPEPATWSAAVLALAAIGFSQRKRLCAYASFAVEKHS
jgi:autotransporter-associated beta strand protein